MTISARLCCALLLLLALPVGLRAQSGAGSPVLLGAPVAAGADVDGAAEPELGAPLGEPVASGPVSTADAVDRLVASLKGYSGRLLATVVPTDDPRPVAGETAPARWTEIFAEAPGLLGEPVAVETTEAPEGPGIYLVERIAEEPSAVVPLPLAVITTVPFDEKRGGYLNGYHIGRYPTEGSGRTDVYAPPAGFIEVTPENQDFRVSEHFRLRQFLTKDQHAVWPKYVALDLRLIDKLELVLQELNEMGVRAEAMHVMSGFRTPQYNGPGGDGRATLSRHTYGDAADVWVDNDGDGYMDDLNGDGRADLDDARVMMMAVERVERRYPELIGGAGVYVANSAHGPFIHIDVRGSRARW